MTIVHCVTVRMSTMTAALAASMKTVRCRVTSIFGRSQLTALPLCSPTSNSRSWSSMASGHAPRAPRRPD